MKTKYSELIEKYVNDELSNEDLNDFLEKVKTNPDLQYELELEQKIANAISDDSVIDFRKQIHDIRSSMLAGQNSAGNTQRTLSIVKSNAKWWLLAASVLILAGIGIYLLLIQSKNINGELYSQYYSPYPAEISERGDSLPDAGSFDKGITEYNKGNYEAAFQHLQIALSSEPSNLPACLYLGITCIELDSISLAKNCFEKIIIHQNSPFEVQAKWYCIMALLSENDDSENERIRAYCVDIIQRNTDRVEESKVILGKIK